jgi:hypothetical protein
MYKKLFWMLLIAVLAAGCNGTVEPTADSTVPAATPTGSSGNVSYPDVEPTVPIVDSAYPGPGQPGTVTEEPGPAPTPLAIPTPSNGLAVITGQLLIGGEGGQPFTGVLYLGSTLAASDPSFPPMVAFSEITDPRAVQEASTGHFMFADVKPGIYALVIWTPVGSTPIEDSTGQYLLVEVQAGDVKDLGIIPIK